MFKSTTTYDVGPTDYLDKVFKNKILPSGFIDKGRCGIGGTTMEINNDQRCSIIIVPNITIVKSKKIQHRQLNVVYGDISHEEVYQYLIEKKPGQKLISTPEGIRKIMKAAEEHGRIEEFKSQWFLMLDEAHSFITEDYREDILAPFEYFWNFTNKCIISATPYYFSDPRMAELDYHKVILTGKLGDVTMIKSASVVATLDYILRHIDEFPGNVHIFYNSVTEISKAIERSGITGCSIFCADDENKKNRSTLGDLWKYFKEQPDESTFAKINFYTCKNFEGWDMYDEDATLILVTDVHREHTKIGIMDKGIQAFGRLRGKKGTDEPPKPHQMIHVTNHLYLDSRKEHPQIIKDYTYNANYLIKQNNEYMLNPHITCPLDDKRLNRFADINKDTKLASLNTMKLDQYINEASTTEVYNNFRFIKEAWETLYEVDPQFSSIKLETTTTMIRKSKITQFKEDYETLLLSKDRQQRGIINWNIFDSACQDIRNANPLAWEAAQLLDERMVKEELKYSLPKIRQEVIMKSNEHAESKLLTLLEQNFIVGRFYTNAEIEVVLEQFYQKLHIKNNKGEIRSASPSQLGENGRFEIKKDKKKDKKGNWIHGYTILRKQFLLTIAA